MKLFNFLEKKHSSLCPQRIRFRKGFSIVEVAIAMGVVTLLLTTFLGIFGPAQKNIQRALSTKDASRMKDALFNEMSILRSTDTTFTSSFEKAFSMIANSHDKASAVLMYEYKANPEDNDNDGILPPFTDANGIQGRDYIIQTAVRALGADTAKIEDELDAVDGPVFVVRMTQLVDTDPSDNQLILTAWDEDGITDPDDPDPAAKLTAATYPKAVVAFRAEFFRLSVNKFSFVSGSNWSFDTIGNALTEVNIATRR